MQMALKQLRTDFGTLYNKISDFNLTDSAANEIFDEAKAWIDLFCSLKGVCPGYTTPRVTPYMHLIPYHLPSFVQRHGCLKKFTGQGVEKNDDAKRILFHKSNKWDGAKDILCTVSRQWDLKHHERKKANYTKRKFEYWGHEISQTRKQKRLQIEDSAQDHDTQELTSTEDYRKFTIKQLREIVKERGLNTKGLSKLKKQELINVKERV